MKVLFGTSLQALEIALIFSMIFHCYAFTIVNNGNTMLWRGRTVIC